MRILFLSRASLFTNKGGDTTQIEQTAKALIRLGIDVTIKTTNEKIDYSAYDLIHFFNIIRPADIMYHIEKSKLPYVVSTIYLDYSSIREQGIKGMMGRILGKNSMEYVKTVARDVVNGERIQWKPYWYKGHKAAIKEILKNAKCLLPNSDSEYQRFKKDFPQAGNYVVVPNGIRKEVFNLDQYRHVQRIGNKVICVGRIEPRKNQLNLIKALNNTEFELYLIGIISTNHKDYYEACQTTAAKNVHFVARLSIGDLLTEMASAQVHVLPSWFETTGLSSLEASAMGCNVVVSAMGDTKPYFRDLASYCEPGDVNSIYNAVKEAAVADQSALRALIEKEYTWDAAAKVTLEVYNKILLK
jgi:glycosyltransferase involved in cell wall biosynthesis